MAMWRVLILMLTMVPCLAATRDVSPKDVVDRYLMGDFAGERISRQGLIASEHIKWVGGASNCDWAVNDEFDYDVDPFYVISSYEIRGIKRETGNVINAEIAFNVIGEVSYPCGARILRPNRMLKRETQIKKVSLTLKKGTAGIWEIVNPTKPYVGTDSLIALLSKDVARLERAQVKAPHAWREAFLIHVKKELDWSKELRDSISKK